MSKKLLSREALERAVRTPATHPAHSDFESESLLLSNEAVRRPVDVVRILVQWGLSPRKAHDVIDRLVLQKDVAVEVSREAVAKIGLDRLLELGVAAHKIAVPHSVDVRSIRNELGLSQTDFALRFGLEIDTVKNWEQGRNKPDRAALLLLHVIRTDPGVVDRVLSASRPTSHAPTPAVRALAKAGFIYTSDDYSAQSVADFWEQRARVVGNALNDVATSALYENGNRSSQGISTTLELKGNVHEGAGGSDRAGITLGAVDAQGWRFTSAKPDRRVKASIQLRQPPGRPDPSAFGQGGHIRTWPIQ